jgi:hypothetical protein
MSTYFNKNRFKKVYGYERVAPRFATVVLSLTESIEVDISRIKVDRQPYYLAEAINASFGGGSAYFTALYEEDVYEVSAFANSATLVFSVAFTDTPILTVETNDDGLKLNNVNLYIDSVSSTGATVKFSAPFSGSITYRAILGLYPALVERTPLLPGSYYTASAGTVLFANESEKTITYNALGVTPTDLFVTPYDYYNTETAQVHATLSNGTSIGNTSSQVDISSPMSNQINFLVVKS